MHPQKWELKAQDCRIQLFVGISPHKGYESNGYNAFAQLSKYGFRKIDCLKVFLISGVRIC